MYRFVVKKRLNTRMKSAFASTKDTTVLRVQSRVTRLDRIACGGIHANLIPQFLSIVIFYKQKLDFDEICVFQNNRKFQNECVLEASISLDVDNFSPVSLLTCSTFN